MWKSERVRSRFLSSSAPVDSPRTWGAIFLMQAIRAEVTPTSSHSNRIRPKSTPRSGQAAGPLQPSTPTPGVTRTRLNPQA